MKNERPNTLLIILVSVGVFAVFASSFMYIWLFLEVRATLTQVSASAEEAQILATQNAHTQTVRRIVRDTQEQIGELNTYFLAEKEIVAFLEDIENLGEHAGAVIDVRTVSVEEAIDKDESIIPLELTLSSTGTLQQVFYTLSLLEVYPKALTFERVSLTQHPTDFSWNGVFNVTVLQAATIETI
ncbi:hypothetical protein JXR01_02375 [Candidatus Kaiserbacteria bacterium]|nr:MAG: hypothetical protein JXR01_02375 [Candidatus Kaiserbacteria bacterium]